MTRKLVTSVVTLLVASAGPRVAAGPRDPMAADPLCDRGLAVAEDAHGLLRVVGPCGGDPIAPASAPAAAAAGPADCLVPGHDDRCETWVAPSYDGPWKSTDYPGFGSFDRHRTIAPHPTEDLVLLGGTSTYTNRGLPDADFVVLAYEASTGQPVWTETYEGLGDRTLAYLTSIVLSPDGERLYAIGIAAVPGVYAYASIVVAFETDSGNRLWARQAPISAEAIETELTTLPDGTVRERIYLAGVGAAQRPDGETVTGGAVAALDAEDGATVWDRRMAGQTPNGARFNELVVSPDGATVYAGGGEHGTSGLTTNWLTAAFRATDGESLWDVRDARTQPTEGTNGISDMAITPDGSRVLVTGFDLVRSGQLLTGSSSAILTIAHETGNGAVAWRRAYGGPVAGETHFYFSLFQGMMGLSPDGRTAVISAAINSHNSTGTVAYDVATGTQTWGVESVEQGYVFTNYLGYYPSVAVGDTTAYVSNRRGIGYSQYRTVTTAYSLSGGTLAWTARFGTNRTLFGGNALSPDQRRLYVTATDQLYSMGFPAPDPGLDSPDIATVAYDA